MRRISLFGVFFLAIAAAVVCADAPASAAPRAGSLNGVVLNSAGTPIPRAVVSWQAADGTRPHSIHTDVNGRFQVMGVRPGLYELRAETGGMSSDWQHNVLVRTGAEASVTLRLTHARAK
jgi:protocatechuate 3,4-dioxygenase beta subunit